ncbi:MAG: hypothetical protein AB1921_07800 [Thermodesulfobacteriota bacterium]
MKKSLLLFLLLVPALILASCGMKKPVSARMILFENNQGVVALPGGEADREEAMDLISSRCKKFSITKEVEEKVGTVESKYAGSDEKKEPGPDQKVVTVDKTELRIYFTCQ